MKPHLLHTLLFLCVHVVLTAQPVTHGDQLLARMRERYDGKWYSTVTFTQRTVMHQKDGTVKEETWFEAARLPGALRIEIAPSDSGNGMLSVRDSLFQFRRGNLRAARPFIHPLMVLGFDVYAQPVPVTSGQLKMLGFDLSKVYETEWQGKRTFVVGAVPGDTLSDQFWIEADRLLFVRSLMKAKNDPSIVQETRFESYQPLCGGWIGSQVLFFTNGSLTMEEHYSDIRCNMTLDERLFEPSLWKTISLTK